jgi:hypothetical protein
MYVRALEFDCWKEGVGIEKKKANPSIDEVEEAINSIDGTECQGVIFFGEGESHLAVGGGASGRYVVYYSSESGEIVTLLSGGSNEEVFTLLIGGQEGIYPGNVIVDLQKVLIAVRAFSAAGKLDSKLQWRKS